MGERGTVLSFTGKNSPPPNSYKIESCFEFNKNKKKGVIIAEKMDLTVKIFAYKSRINQ